jgi:hypothetical protein
MPGFGVYHTGIEIGGVEYSFAGSPDAPPNTTGVMTQQPRATPADGQWKFKESLELGEVTVSHSEFQATLRELQDAFPANQYDLIHRNCNVFTKTVAKRLGVADKYPGWVNRAASWGSAFVAPPKNLNSLDAPPPPVSVFKSTTGYKLDGSTVKPDKKAAAASSAGKPAASSEAKKPEAGEQKRTSGAPAAGGSARKNPWADPNFLPPSVSAFAYTADELLCAVAALLDCPDCLSLAHQRWTTRRHFVFGSLLSTVTYVVVVCAVC